MRMTPFSLTAPLLALLIALVACSAPGAPEPPPPVGQDTLQQPGHGDPAVPVPALSGVVRELGDDELVLERIDGTSVTVTLSEETTIRQQMTAGATDVTPGTPVTVMAEEQEGRASAALVQIGEATGPLMSPGVPAAPGSAPAAMPLGAGGPAGPKPRVYRGSVREVGNGTITLQRDSGELLAIRLTAQTRYQQEVSVDRGALEVGALVIAEGERDGNVFRAATIRVLSPV